MKYYRPLVTSAFFVVSSLLSLGSQAEVRSVFVQSTLDYNAILITEVDVVFVYSEDALAMIPDTKSAWYGNKRQLLESSSESIDVVNLFIPQGFDSSMLSLPERRGEALKVFVFGQHDVSTRAPIDISAMENVQVEINQFGIVVTPRN
ncbi:MAG: hypothetical protein O2861_10465 [Proteobacteria bacterium]|nr:hypothetical protein [Pseudomonadota bacterium]